MKKLKLNFQQLNAEVLTRSQLKQILGGDGSGGSTPNCSTNDCTVLVTGVGLFKGFCGYTQYLTVCECITPYGDYYPNGGTSHCSPQL